MSFVLTSIDRGIATVTLNRPKVNAINEPVAQELLARLHDLAADSGVQAVILTGQGSFFSFGLDIPEFLGYTKDAFIRFVTTFAELYTYLFEYPKPVIAALNGHTVAGGCMIASACDARVMVSGKGRISLNEINFGSSLFPGSAVMLQYCVGTRNAEIVAFTGAMFSPEEAQKLGLVDQVVTEEDLYPTVNALAEQCAKRHAPAYQSIKMLLRKDTAEEMKRKDNLYRDKMVDIWYSEHTWKQLQNIKIRG
jgi:enoyl-CoA hydratase/carnithine racemase